MKFALSAFNQGAGAHITLPGTLANTSGTAWIIGGTAIVHDLTANRNLLGSSSSTQNVLRFYPDGSVAMRAGGNDRITTAAGAAIVDDEFAWEVRNNTTTGNWEFFFNDLMTPVGVFGRGTAAWAMNQLCRFSTTASPFFTIRSFYAAGAASFVDSWDDTTASSTGTGWLSTSGTRSLTLVGATGAADSWWVGYGSSYIGESIFSIAAAATVTINGYKVGTANTDVAADAVLAAQGLKVGAAVPTFNATAAVSLNGNKVGVATIYIEAQASISLYASNIVQGEGTFSISAAAAISVQGGKVGNSKVQFEATAAAYCASSKVGNSITPVAATAALPTDGSKVGFGTIVVLASATISMASHSDAEPAPVTIVFVRTSSRFNYQLKTLSRYGYTLKTHSGGARVQ